MTDSDLVRVAKAVGRRLPAPVTRALRFAWHKRGALRARRTLRATDPGIAAWAASERRPVSIVIPSYNDVPLLTKCLASIESTLAGRDYEVIVVDDYCQPANSEKLRNLETERVRVLFKDERGGFAVTVNQGMAAARHDIVLLNSDIVALPGWLDALQHAVYGGIDDRIGLVSARLLYPDGRIQYGGTVWSRTWAPQWFSHRYAGHLADHAPASIPDYNWGASGACLYVSRATYEALGGLDEAYWLGFEDVDYAMRAWEQGIRSFYEPRAALVHHESATRGRHQGNRELASMRLFWHKWARYHTEKTGGAPTRVLDVLLDPAAGPLWRRYVEGLAHGLAEAGWDVHRHEFAPETEAALVDVLSPRASIVLATSPATLRPAWLATVTSGIPVHLLPEIAESPSASTVASLKPEFDYVATSRWAATTLERRTSWPATAVIAPAIAPGDPGDVPRSGVAVVTLDAPSDASAIAAIRGRWPDVNVLETSEIHDGVLDDLRALAPRVLVCLAQFSRSLEPLLLMSFGAAFVGATEERTAFEVMDGLNALLVPRGDIAMLLERIEGILSDDAAFESLRQNGFRTATERARDAVTGLGRALDGAAQLRG